MSLEDSEADEDTARNIACCMGEMDVTDKTAAQEFAKQVKEAQLEVILATETDENGKRRKKRASRNVRQSTGKSKFRNLRIQCI